jgi:phasin family protein
MAMSNEDFVVQAWKQQLDLGLRVAEVLVEGATRLREMQLKVATDAHAQIEATRRSVSSAADVSRLMELQIEWARANAEKGLAYWRELYELAAQTQSQLARSAYAPAAQAAAASAPSTDDPKKAVMAMLDQAYKQWFEATQQFYKLPPMPASPKPDRRTAA